MGNALHAGLARPLVSNSFAIRTSANPFSQPLYSCNLQTPPVTAHSKALITLADSTHPRNRPDNPFLFRTYKKPGEGAQKIVFALIAQIRAYPFPSKSRAMISF